jgi:AraC-like DNA-binding protein
MDVLEFRSYAEETRSHDHDFWQVVLPVRGCLDMDVGGRSGAVLPGQGVVIPAGTSHAFQAGGDNRFLVADVKSLALDDRAVSRFGNRPFFGVAPALQALVDYRRSASSFPGDLAAHWCAMLLVALGEAPVLDDRQADAVRKAVAFMRAEMARPVTVQEMADAAGLPAHRLNAAFHRLHGKSPYAYLTELRFREALRLLAETRLPIAEIADLTGHADQSALTRRLKRHAGVSPAVYRRARSLK